MATKRLRKVLRRIFQSSFKLADDCMAATMRLLGGFYKEIIQTSPIEKNYVSPSNRIVFK